MAQSSRAPWLETIWNTFHQSTVNRPDDFKITKQQTTDHAPDFAVGVVLASSMYPYKKQKKSFQPIALSSLSKIESEDVKIFAAAINKNPNQPEEIIPKDGRVFTVTAKSTHIDQARKTTYNTIPKIKKYWDNFHYRTDIAKFDHQQEPVD